VPLYEACSNSKRQCLYVKLKFKEVLPLHAQKGLEGGEREDMLISKLREEE